MNKSGYKSAAQKILSIIIPMYNAAPYIKKCLDSMLMEEEEMNRLEILAVDDGSTDGTHMIVENYVRRFPDTVVLLRKENGGHGSAINLGVKNCTGRYLKVVDADDWVRTQGLRRILALLEEMAQMDVVLSGYETFDIRNGAVRKVPVNGNGNGQKAFFTLREVMRDWNRYKRLFCLHGLIYGTAFYRGAHWELPEHVYYDDAYYDVVFASRARKLCVADIYLYVYRVGDIHQSVSNVNRTLRIHEMETVLLQILETVPDESKIFQAANVYWYRRVSQFLSDYFITAFLREKNKKVGRQVANAFYQKIKILNPKIHRISRKNYMLLKAMNLLHIQEAWLELFFYIREWVGSR